MTENVFAHCSKCGSKDTILVDDIQKLLKSREPPYKCNSCGSRFYATFFSQSLESKPRETET